MPSVCSFSASFVSSIRSLERAGRFHEVLKEAHHMLCPIGVEIRKIAREVRFGVHIATVVYVQNGGPQRHSYGKSLDPGGAVIGALMEAVERCAGELVSLPVVVGTFEELSSCGSAAMDPANFVAPRLTRNVKAATLEWVEGRDLVSERTVLVPLNVVACPYRPRHGQAFVLTSSNGLASGETLGEALVRALCEVIERDAVALAGLAVRADWARLCSPRGMASLPSMLPIPSQGPVGTVLAEVCRTGFRPELRDVTSDVGIATFACLLATREGQMVAEGFSTDADPACALLRAVCEATQVSAKAELRGPKGSLLPINVAQTAARAHISPDDEQNVLHALLSGLRRAGLTECVAVDLTSPFLGLPVVRVVVSGAETWPVFRSAGLPAVVGARGARIIRQVAM